MCTPVTRTHSKSIWEMATATRLSSSSKDHKRRAATQPSHFCSIRQKLPKKMKSCWGKCAISCSGPTTIEVIIRGVANSTDNACSNLPVLKRLSRTRGCTVIICACWGVYRTRKAWWRPLSLAWYCGDRCRASARRKVSRDICRRPDRIS